MNFVNDGDPVSNMDSAMEDHPIYGRINQEEKPEPTDTEIWNELTKQLAQAEKSLNMVAK